MLCNCSFSECPSFVQRTLGGLLSQTLTTTTNKCEAEAAYLKTFIWWCDLVCDSTKFALGRCSFTVDTSEVSGKLIKNPSIRLTDLTKTSIKHIVNVIYYGQLIWDIRYEVDHISVKAFCPDSIILLWIIGVVRLSGAHQNCRDLCQK